MQGDWLALQQVTVLIEIALDCYQSKPTGLMSFDRYPDGALW
jgi:hypothetical protein